MMVVAAARQHRRWTADTEENSLKSNLIVVVEFYCLDEISSVRAKQNFSPTKHIIIKQNQYIHPANKHM